nr:hypothetical protein [Lachnospiraceae bacterium]
MKKTDRTVRKNRLLSGLLCLLLLCASLMSSCASSPLKKVSFTYQSGTMDEESYMYYTDGFFRRPSTEYNASLATASLSFAMSSFASIEDYRYDHRYVNGEELLEELGFRDITANAFFHEKPGTDSFGVMIGRKDLDGATLLAVGLRGANYESEWASNFTIGTETDAGGYHKGFYEASEIILGELKNYVSSNGLQGRIKMWISGYSRAGAACNVASGRLDEFIRDGVPFLGDAVQLAKEDLYSYCFEAPQGAPLDESRYAKSDTFSNIFCIINPNDPVPKVPMTAMGFTRFGREILLPTELSDLHFDQSLETVRQQYSRLRSFGDWGIYRISDFSVYDSGKFSGFKVSLSSSGSVRNWTQAQYLDELLTAFAETIGSREDYTASLQDGLRDLFRLAYARKNTSASLKDIALQFARELLMTDEISVLTDDLMHNRSRLRQDAAPIIHRALLRMGLDTELAAIEKTVIDLVNALFSTLLNRFYMFPTLLSLNNLKAVSSAHYPELCLAYLRAMDPNYVSDPVSVPLDGKYYVLTISSGTKVTVRQGSELIAAVEDDLPAETEYQVPNGLWAGMIRIVLPAHETYQVTVSSGQSVTLTLEDPGRVESTEQAVSFTQTAEGYRFDIAPAD